MNYYSLFKPASLAVLLIKEQLKEPVALFWTVLSPVVTYYLFTYTRAGVSDATSDYVSSTSWFYAFVSSNVALFGLAFYIVGRRESGFLRSFVYTASTRAVFLIGQFLAYSFISMVYCFAFYILTRSYFGGVDIAELLVVIGRFYMCFILFSIPSLLLTLVPLGFQNANTVFSVMSLAMLVFGIASSVSFSPALDGFRLFNPMWWANQIMVFGVKERLFVIFVIVILFVCSFWMTFRFLLINPVWSRY